MGTETQFDWESFRRTWPAPIVPRTSFGLFSGGLYEEKYLANQDAAGVGPQGAFRIGRKVVYPTLSAIEWLRQRAASIVRSEKGNGIDGK